MQKQRNSGTTRARHLDNSKDPAKGLDDNDCPTGVVLADFGLSKKIGDPLLWDQSKCRSFGFVYRNRAFSFALHVMVSEFRFFL